MKEKSSRNSHVFRNVLLIVFILAVVSTFLSPESSVRCAAAWHHRTMQAFTSPIEKNPPRLRDVYPTTENQIGYRFLEPPLGGIGGRGEYWLVYRYGIFYLSETYNGG